MTRFCAVLLLVAGSTGLTAQEIPGRSQGSPRIAAEESTKDWGEILKGSKFEHTFQIRNDGDVPLLIENVKTT